MTDVAPDSRSADYDLSAECHARNGCIGCLATLIMLVLVGYAWWKIEERAFKAARYPYRISVTRTIFEVEESWGFGPGGNETGIVVKQLSERDAERLTALAPTMLGNASIRVAVGAADRDYGVWRQTPVDTADANWKTSRPVDHAPRINDYLDKYGFHIAIDKTITSQIDQVLSKPGSYYAYGGGGSIIVIAPGEKLVIYAYAG